MSWLTAVATRYRAADDPLRTLRRVELTALVLGLLLCLQLAWDGFRLATLSPPPPVAPAADALRVPAVAGPALVDAGDRNEIITRPLFWPSRRAAEEVATLRDADSTPGELKSVKLVGVFGSGEQAGIIALVQNRKQRILTGETLEGWTLQSAAPDAVVLTNGKRSETLTLQYGTSKAAAAKGAAPAKAAEVAPDPERTLGLGPEVPELKRKKTDQ